jgi:hypothetical protein
MIYICNLFLLYLIRLLYLKFIFFKGIFKYFLENVEFCLFLRAYDQKNSRIQSSFHNRLKKVVGKKFTLRFDIVNLFLIS